MGRESGENELYPLGRRTVLKSAAASSMAAGGLPQALSTSAAAAQGPLFLEDIEGKPDYPRGEKLGFFVWYDESRIYVRFNTDGKFKYVYKFDIRIEGGELSNVETTYWNETERLSVSDTRIHGRGIVLSGSDGFSFAIEDFDKLTLDLRHSYGISESLNAEEKRERVENTATPVQDHVYLGADSLKPTSYPVDILGAGNQLTQKASSKQELIDKIRQLNVDIDSMKKGGLLPLEEANKLDSRAQDLVDTVYTNQDTFTIEEATQHRRALNILISTEQAGLAATAKPIKVARRTSGLVLETAVMYIVEKTGDLYRLTERTADSPIIKYVTDSIGRVADTVFSTVKNYLLNAISGSVEITQKVADEVANFISYIQSILTENGGSELIHEVGKTAATKGVEKGVEAIDSGVIGQVKDFVADFTERLAQIIYEEYYLSEIVAVSPLPGEQMIEQAIETVDSTKVGIETVELPDLVVPKPLDEFGEPTGISDLKDEIKTTVDRITPGGIDPTMDERAAAVSSAAGGGGITSNHVDTATSVSSDTETAISAMNDTCLWVFDAITGLIGKAVSRLEWLLVGGGLLSYVARTASSSVIAGFGVLFSGPIVSALIILGKFMLYLTAFGIVSGSIVLRITANIHWIGTFAGVPGALTGGNSG